MILKNANSKCGDWWSLSILLYEILMGIDPFIKEYPMVIYQNMITKNKISKNIRSVLEYIKLI
jgi:serine/threonine protein kinase